MKLGPRLCVGITVTIVLAISRVQFIMNKIRHAEQNI